MSDKGRLFTSESVTEGHPDKICDAISDSVLDALLAQDPDSRVAVETLVTTGQVHVVGEVTTTAKEAFADIPTSCASASSRSATTRPTKGFDGAIVRRQHRHRRPVARHRAGRRHRLRGPGRRRARPARRPGRRRPGPDVRLRDPRHPRADAAADRAGAPAGAPADRGPQERRAAVPAARRQDPGHHPVRRQHPDAAGHRRAVDPARRRHRPGEDADPRHPGEGRQHRARRPGPRDAWTPPTSGCWSTPPASSSSAARWATPA